MPIPSGNPILKHLQASAVGKSVPFCRWNPRRPSSRKDMRVLIPPRFVRFSLTLLIQDFHPFLSGAVSVCIFYLSVNPIQILSHELAATTALCASVLVHV